MSNEGHLLHLRGKDRTISITCWRTISSMTQVVSADGSAVSPDTNIIWPSTLQCQLHHAHILSLQGQDHGGKQDILTQRVMSLIYSRSWQVDDGARASRVTTILLTPLRARKGR